MKELIAFLHARLDEDKQAARVLAEVEANRRIINLCEEWEEWVEIGEITPHATWSDEAAGGAVARVLSLMALPYADHPDYDPAWASGGY